MKDPIHDYGTPEEEAMRFRIMPFPLVWRFPRLYQTWPYKCSYYDHPEGEDLLGKIVAINRPILPYAAVWGMMDACMFTNQPTAMLRFMRTVHFIWPVAVGATCFATGAYAAAKIRGKHDFGNDVVGALCGGAVIAKWGKKGLWGWHAAFIIAVAAGFQRIAKSEGWEFFHEIDLHSNDHTFNAESVRWHKIQRGLGWELYKDPGKEYTTTTMQ